jgi:hypothetical protein
LCGSRTSEGRSRSKAEVRIQTETEVRIEVIKDRGRKGARASVKTEKIRNPTSSKIVHQLKMRKINDFPRL